MPSESVFPAEPVRRKNPATHRWVFVILIIAFSSPAVAAALAAASERSAEQRLSERSRPSSVSLPKNGATLPLLPPASRPMIEVTIGDQGPFRFMIETGSWVSTISPETAARLGLSTAGGDTTIQGITIKAGDAVFQNLGVVVTGLRPEIDGQLALPAFAGILLTVDTPAGVVRLEKGSLPKPNGKDVLPLAPIGPLWGVEMEAAGVKLLGFLDTQGGGGIAVVPEIAAGLRFEATPAVTGRVSGPLIGDREVRTGRLAGDVRIGMYRFERPLVTSFPLTLRFPNQGVTLGNRLLRDFAVTFDQKNRRVRLAHAGPATFPAPPPVRGFGFLTHAALGRFAQPSVSSVEEDGPAAKAGVAVGDFLILADGKTAESLTAADWGELSARETPVTFRFRHEGEERDVEITARTVVP